MNDEKFATLIARMKRDKTIRVHLGSITYAQFEELLSEALSNNLLKDINFTGFFDQTQKRIVCNLYLASKYYKKSTSIDQLDKLMLKHNIPKSFDFDFRFNHTKHNVELQSYTLRQLAETRVAAEIESFKRNPDSALMVAIKHNFVMQILRVYYFVGHVNKIISGKLPVVYACELEQSEALKTLLYDCNADVYASDANDMSALTALANKNNNFGNKFLMEMLQRGRVVIFTPFAMDEPNYHSNLDLIKILVDAENIAVLDFALKFSKIIIHDPDGIKFVDVAIIKAMYKYAKEHKKSAVITKILAYVTYALKVEENFRQAIIENNTLEFVKHIRIGADINSELQKPSFLELMCMHDRDAMLTELLTIRNIPRLQVIVLAQESYNSYTDILSMAIKYKSMKIIEAYLAWLKMQDLDVLPSIISSLEYSRLHSPELAAILYDMLLRNMQEIIDLVSQRKYKDLIKFINNGGNINFGLGGNTVMHELCRQNEIPTIMHCLQAGADMNIDNGFGVFPITVSINAGHKQLALFLFRNEAVRVFAFDAQDRDGYNKNLDPLMLTIDKDDASLLEEIFKANIEVENKLGELNLEYLAKLRVYAQSVNAARCLELLIELTQRLRRGNPLFANHQESLLSLYNNSQNVGSTDRSVFVSMCALAKYYGFEIVDVPNESYKRLQSETHDVEEIFSRLSTMIDAVTKSRSKIKVGKELIDMSLDSYKQSARYIYELIKDEVGPRHENKRVWRSTWIIQGHDGIRKYDNKGITLMEMWALVILAIQDPNPMPGVYWDPEEIHMREADLVETLVACAREYNRAEHFIDGTLYLIDDGTANRPSCLHGIGNRPYNDFNKRHSCINIINSPTSWALDEVFDAVNLVFEQHPKRELIAQIYLLRATQLNAEQTALLESFYLEASTQASNRIIAKIGLLGQGGLLTQKEFDGALSSVPYTRLRSLTTSTVIDEFLLQNDFTIANKSIVSNSKDELLPYKLPRNPDAIFCALILAARDQGLPVDDSMLSIISIRNQIADALESAMYVAFEDKVFFSQTFRVILKRRCMQQIFQDNMVPELETENKRVIDKAIEQYLLMLRSNATPSILVLELLCHLWNIQIDVYSIEGVFLTSISARNLCVVPPETCQTLNVCVMTIQHEDKQILDFTCAHPLLVQSTLNITDLNYRKAQLDIKPTLQLLIEDEVTYPAFKPMPQRNIVFAGQKMQQIKIPHDGDCEFNAALYAIKNLEKILKSNRNPQIALNANLTEHVSNIETLRIMVQEKLRHLLAIQRLEVAEDLITDVGQSQVKGGLAVITAIAHILKVTISVQKNGGYDEWIVTDKSWRPEHHIYLTENAGHFNILLPNSMSWLIDPNTEVSKDRSPQYQT